MCGSCCGGWTFLHWVGKFIFQFSSKGMGWGGLVMEFVRNAVVSKRSALPRFNLRWRRPYIHWSGCRIFGDLCATVSFQKTLRSSNTAWKHLVEVSFFLLGFYHTIPTSVPLFYLIVKILLCNRYIRSSSKGDWNKTKNKHWHIMCVDIALTAVVQWNKARGVKRPKKK